MINIAVSVKPRTNKWFAIGGSFLVWGGAVLSAKYDNIVLVLLGAILALAGSWLLTLSLIFIWKVKNEELPVTYAREDVVVIQGCVTGEECLEEQSCSCSKEQDFTPK
jgi:hypothetical protein